MAPLCNRLNSRTTMIIIIGTEVGDLVAQRFLTYSQGKSILSFYNKIVTF